ncbi:cyclin-domain-containing protein [Stachybotrys elegans]|uniref:Cyclin-domain-containing protein n=1 Tax=Stachybotrys elegans TaxID=80388 RepID=A0A8K0WZ43_9HYPO|nr:cyclin-domain-containing protein [Stachybotrys elegans]
MSEIHTSASITVTTTIMTPPQHDQPTLHLQQSEAPAPVPASDPGLSSDSSSKENEPNDLFKLPAAEALKLLSASVELLVRLTGDIPPTPPPQTPTDPQMTGMQAEKEQIVRSHSERSLARMRQQAEKEMQRARQGATENRSKASTFSRDPETIDGVYLRPNNIPSPPSPSAQQKPYVVIGADSQPLNLQHGAITRKFYSKNEPPISINQYLLRLHQFCPMSTAVYLATSLYIHRLAVEEQAIPVTRRNAHRLVLAGLRVAMKALEDLSYPHAKIAKVGGVSEMELARLEISFCFLAGFELVVGEEQLNTHLNSLKDGRARHVLSRPEVPALKLDPRTRMKQRSDHS